MRKKTFTLLFVFCILIISSCSIAHDSATTGSGIQISIGVGSIIAIVASWSRNQSVLWAILHAFLGWFYVIYYVLTRNFRN